MAEHLTKQMTNPLFKDCFVASFDLVSSSSFRFVEFSPDGAPPRLISLSETAVDRSTVFLPKDWSVFKQARRINSDIEWWH